MKTVNGFWLLTIPTKIRHRCYGPTWTVKLEFYLVQVEWLEKVCPTRYADRIQLVNENMLTQLNSIYLVILGSVSLIEEKYSKVSA